MSKAESLKSMYLLSNVQDRIMFEKLDFPAQNSNNTYLWLAHLGHMTL